jgi:hypothetical protein
LQQCRTSRKIDMAACREKWLRRKIEDPRNFEYEQKAHILQAKSSFAKNQFSPA